MLLGFGGFFGSSAFLLRGSFFLHGVRRSYYTTLAGVWVCNSAAGYLRHPANAIRHPLHNGRKSCYVALSSDHTFTA